MVAVRHVGRLAAIAGATGALLMLTSPARAHAGIETNNADLTLASTASAAMSIAMRDEWVAAHGWPSGDRLDDDWKPVHRHHGKKDVPEPGTLGLYVSALLGAALFLRKRKSRSR